MVLLKTTRYFNRIPLLLMVKKMPLKYRLILGGIAAVVIPFLITGAAVYIQISNSLLEMSKEKSIHFAEDISYLIQATLMQEIKLAKTIAANPDIIAASKSGNYHEAQIEIQAIYESVRRDFFTLFLVDRDGIARVEAVYENQIGLDLSDRDYFLDAKNGNTGVKGPFFPRETEISGETVVIVYAPIEENGTVYGIAATLFNSDFIADILKQKKTGQTGHAFLINSEGLVLVHPNKIHNLKLNLLGQPGMDKMRELIRSGKTGTALYELNTAQNIAGVTNEPLTGWTVVFTQERDEIMAPANILLFTIFISGIIFLAITITIIILFSDRISSPIQKMMGMIRHVTQHATEIILQIGTDRKITYANPAFEEITGLASEEILGTEPDLYNTGNIPPEVIWEGLESGKPWSGRVTLTGDGRDEATLDVMLVPFINSKGGVEGYLEIGRNISSELLYEKRLQQAQKLEAIGTLAGGIAHDFNNVLSGIFGYAELTLTDVACNPEIKENMREILKASERARDLVKQILTFSRQSDVELQPLLPETIVKEALKLLRASIPTAITIESEIRSRSRIMAEPTRFHQIIMNLFTNAVHAIGDNTGTIKLELDDFFVDEAFVNLHPDIKAGDHIRLRISDTGKGIEQKDLEQIFEPFFTTKSQGEGTGLGLSVVHGIVKKLGGIITVYSEVGSGTVFNIIIPIAETDDVEKNPGVASVREGTERIVIIDDEKAITATMQSILSKLGYQVTTYTDGLAALAEIKSNPDSFDIIITDYSMPKITGLELITQLKKSGIRTPMILVSGYIGGTVKNAALDAGAATVIAKPVNTYQLTDAIHRVSARSPVHVE